MKDGSVADSLLDSSPIIDSLIRCGVFNDQEDATFIESAILLRTSCFKRWLLVPLLSVITALVFPIFLYWKPKLRRDYLYSRASTLVSTTHVFVTSRDQNMEIVTMENLSSASSAIMLADDDSS